MTPSTASATKVGRIVAAVVLGAGWLVAGAQSMPPSGSTSSDAGMSSRGSMSSREAMSYDTSKPAGPVVTGPEVKHEGDVAFVTGGVGADTRARTQELGSDMNLKLVFAQTNGNFLADIDVSIAARDGRQVLQLGSADPLLYVKLPPGTYDITASVGGRSIERQVRVPARGTHQEVFSWPASASAQG